MDKEQQKFYFDTCTIIDAIDHTSRYHANVRKALQQVKGDCLLSEYMEVELKGVLRKSKFRKMKDSLLREYAHLKRNLQAKWIPNNEEVINLHKFAKKLQKDVQSYYRRRRIYVRRVPKFPDIVHIGICGLKDITNIVSEDKDIYGRDSRGVPIIDIVKNAISKNIKNISNPRHVCTSREGYLKQVI